MTGQRYTKVNYFSQRLEEELLAVEDYPLTVIEASSGYGKTTAAADYLVKKFSGRYQCLWYTCIGEPAEEAWLGICKLLRSVDHNAANCPERFFAPGRDACAKLMAQMEHLQCQEPLLLVMDNFQLARFPQPRRLLDVLSFHHCLKLHIVVLTQPLAQEGKNCFINSRIHWIKAKSLIFSKGDVEAYFKTADIRLNQREIGFLLDTTEGWAAAVNLQLQHYKREGRFADPARISMMMEQVLWKQLDRDQQELFVALSVLDCFVEAQALAMGGEEQPLTEFSQLLKHDFICRTRDNSAYRFHYLLQLYLRSKFLQQTREQQQRILKRAGDSCARMGDYLKAACFYSRLGAYEELLQLPFSVEDRFELVYYDEGRIAERFLSEPAREWLLLYPELALGIALELFIQGRFGLHQCYYLVVEQALKQRRYEGERLKRLKGEFAMMRSFLAFNDVEAMCGLHRQAYGLLQGMTKLHSFKDAWTVGTPSVVSMFWRESGKLGTIHTRLKQMMPCYCRLTKGSGTGAPEAMEAEMFLLAGETETAKQKAYGALALAEQAQQDSLLFCGTMILARIAMYDGDGEAYLCHVDWIGNKMYDSSERGSELTGEVCQAFLNVVLNHYKAVPDWLYHRNNIKRRCPFMAIPFTCIIYGSLMLEQMQRRDISYAYFEHIITGLIKESELQNMLYPKVYYLIYLAIGREAWGNSKEALLSLNEALALAVPDRVYLPFAEYYQSLYALLGRKVWSTSEQEAADQITRMGKRMTNRLEQLRRYIVPNHNKLTGREAEIAQLLQQRLSVKEIAEKLQIKPSTVSNIMQKVYGKLDIHSRKELIELGDRILHGE